MPNLLREAGRVLSRKNEGKLRQAHGHLSDVLSSVGVMGNSETTNLPNIPDDVLVHLGMMGEASSDKPLYWLDEKQFSQDKRDALAQSGAAMSDGSFPIETAADLKNAIAAYGRSPDNATKSHIVKRAKALNLTDQLPADWPGSTKKAESLREAGNVGVLISTFGDWAGGSEATCAEKLSGKVDNPDALCAWLKDQATGSTSWRGKASATPIAPNLTEAERSWGQIQMLVTDAVVDQYVKPGMDRWDVYVTDMYDDYAIVCVDGAYWSVPWAIVGTGDVQLGEPTEVVQAYVDANTPTANDDNDGDDGVLAAPGVPSTESATLTITGDLIPLVEKAVRKDGTTQIKIIQPGWGSSAFYPADVLREQGPKVFTKGLHMHIDHPTATEESDRPERSVSTIASVLDSDAYWLESGPAGPGLYADAKVFGGFREVLDELAPHIGVSIRASGRARDGEAEGRTGKVLEAFDAAYGVDYVTLPGAGGQVLSLFESARAGQFTPQPKETPMSEQALKEAQTQLTELRTELARMRERQMLAEARTVAATTLAAIQMPDVTRARLVESLAANPPAADDGALDRPAFVTRVQEAATRELDYLAEVAPTGAIRGMGPVGEPKEFDDAAFTAGLTESFSRLGLKGTALDAAVRGR